MISLLEAAAATEPSRPAVVTSEGHWSYEQLLDDARRIAAALRARAVERFAVVESDAAWVIRLLAGAALCGAEPCQYQPDTPAAEFAAQAATLGHDVVVTSRTDLSGAAAQVLRPHELLRAEPELMEPPGSEPVMIRTTGTTGVPKAARHDWKQLVKAVSRVRAEPEQRWLLAYGPHQFGGVQVLLHVLAARATLVAPFPRQPADGLDALLTHEVTCASATPTYWRFLLAEARSRRVALPPLTHVTLGGEAVPEDLLAELRTAFPEAKIAQVYASTEFGSVTSVGDGRPGLSVAALHGPDNPGAKVKVVDGELWVRAEGGMLGYAGETPPVPAPEADGWYPTGDLVEIVGDRVLFRGRRSEIINVGGVKVPPLPIEERISALEGVAVARVYGRPNALTGAIVAVEVVPAAGTGSPEVELLRERITAAVADFPRAWHPRSIRFVDAIETRGGKAIRGIER